MSDFFLIQARVNNDWFSKAAAEMDIELDDDLLVHDEDAEENAAILQQKQNQSKTLLKRPFNAKQPLGLYDSVLMDCGGLFHDLI